MDTQSPFEPTLESVSIRAANRSQDSGRTMLVIRFPDSNSFGIISEETFRKNLAAIGFVARVRYVNGKQTGLSCLPPDTIDPVIRR